MTRKKQIFISSIILILALATGIGISVIIHIINETPDISTYQGASEATLVYSADGELLTKLYEKNRINVPLEQIPSDLQNAIIAIEDNDFYVHHGIDFWGIARAVVNNIMKRGGRPQGASTITQQLAGNALLDRQNISYYRKIQEAYLALQFERQYTKPQILEMYLNEIFLGHSAYGVEAASQQYFNKSVQELNLSECALLAGIPRSPNYYSPINNYQSSVERRNLVLRRMLDLGYISEDEFKNAREYEIKLESSNSNEEDTAPYFVRYIRDELIDKFGAQMVYSGGLKVYTTLDPDMQRKAEDNIRQLIENNQIPTHERENTADKMQPQMAIISIEPSSGAIRSMVGGRGNDQFNRAVQARRQPGSAFKPFVYTTAIKNGWSAANVINDMPMFIETDEFPDGRVWPRNYGDSYRGHVNLRTAIKHSINIAAVKLIKEVGVMETIETAENMGVTSFQAADKNREHYSLALGGLNRGISPLEMANAYGVLANDGIWVEPHSILKVLDQRDNLLYEAHPEKRLVLESEDAYIMNSLLRSVIKDVGGTGWRANLPDRDVAGKTGTTNNYTDAWFVGYTPDIVTSVWIGEDISISMEYPDNTVSSAEAAQLWGNYMRDVVSDMPVNNFKVPEGITTARIDPITGLLANEYTPNPYNEIFKTDNIPTEIEDLHEPIITEKICRESGQLATSECPEENIIEYTYLSRSGYKIGPESIAFQITRLDENNEDERINANYYVDNGEPIQLIDEEIGIPRTENGRVIYEKLPEEKCSLHAEETDQLIDSIWDFFNMNR